MAGAVLGTPEFMSPEQASGLEIDGRSDLYSLGVVLYHALSGQLPYRGEHPLATIHHVMHDPHPPIGSLVQVPEWLALLVERCLEKSLQHRIQTGEEIAWCLSRKMPPKLTTDQPTVVLPSPVKTPEPVPGATPLPRQTAVSPPRPLVKEPVVVALAALIFLTVLSLGYLVLGDVVSSGPMIMPAVTYNSLEAAKQQLDRLGLRIETIEGPTQGRAIVISQSPTAGQRIEPRTSVILTTKTATPLVPSVVQLTQLAATVKLEGEGFVVVPMRVAGPLEMSNKVIHQNPGPGTPAPDGKVYISIVR
jgi:serine/threonine-protein kinase